jgi:16S rRNA (guanine966-N2)-methyltransferase
LRGEFRGRTLSGPRSGTIRPTSDRTREAVFNVLAHRFPGRLDRARVLDLFAGTGALGLEALSRGAAFALFVEESVEGRGLIRQNVERLGLQGRTKVFRRDATRLGHAGTLPAYRSPLERLSPFRPRDLVDRDGMKDYCR